MRHLFKLTEGVITMPLMARLARHSELWNADPLRTTFEGTPHAAADDILLRFGTPNGDDLEAADTPAMAVVSGARAMALNVMNLVEGSRLGRVVVTRLQPGTKILPHADVKGAYSHYYTRFHVVLQGLPGSLFNCGDESVNMRTGEIWWANLKEEHSVMNNSKDDRVHMLVDVRVDK